MMRFKTLLKHKGTRHQEFIGYDLRYGWLTSDRPIRIMNHSVTLDDVRNSLPISELEEFELVTIEIKIVD